MVSGRRWTWFIWGLGGFCLAVVAAMGAWAALQGPLTVYRVIVNGETTIEDYKRYPFRPLTPSLRPYRFKEAPQPELARVAVAGRGEVDLVDLLEGSSSVSFLVVKDERLLFERYFQGHDRSTLVQTFSVSKSILSFLIGAAIEDGVIGGVDDVVTAYVPELSASGFDKVRIVDLLQMNSGMDYVENDNPFGQHVRFNYTPDLENEILALHVRPVPQHGFTYKSGESALLGLVLKRALKEKTISQYTQGRLWEPLGMEYGGLWSLDAEGGLEKAWCCLSATARDLAKFGALYRDRGMWQGAPILPMRWVADSTINGPFSPDRWWHTGFWNYGYQWWLVNRERGDFMARGKDGQFIYVDPASGVVVVRLGPRLGTYGGNPLTVDDWSAFFQAVAAKAAAL
ncbi:MAG: serine hydrolase [Rhodospirillales bacterium]|nr:serine hydrolase [Rhodospirillales bacterium]